MPDGHRPARPADPHHEAEGPALPFPYADRIRAAEPAQVFQWLAAGWRDMRAAGWVSFAYGAVFVVLGYVIGWGLATFEMLYLLTPMIAGFLLVAPLLAVGLYRISSRLEKGERPGLLDALLAWRTNTFHILTAGLVVMLFMMIWVRIAALIFAVSFPYTNMSVGALVQQMATAEGLVFLGVGTAVGFCFAAVAFVLGAFSLPMMLDRRADVFAGAIVSAQAVLKSPRTMVLWAAVIVVVTGFGLVTAFLGLIVALPLIGHATWHAYRDCVEWDD